MEYKIFSARIAHLLYQRGFAIIRTEANMKKPWLSVFVFEDCPQLRTALQEVTAEE